MTTAALPSVSAITKPRRFAREFGIAFGLFALWQYLVWLKGRHTPIGAVSRGRDIYTVERWLHLPSEASTQQFFHPLWHFANVYYDSAHVGLMAIFLIYVAWRHSDKWRYYRAALFTATFAGLAMQFALSTAPPRFIGRGIIDTANLQGVSIYSAAGKLVDQYSTFPSLHVAWAAIVAVCAWNITTSRVRYIFAAHLPLTIFAVVVTGNHFWLDCVAGFALAYAASRIWRHILP